MRSLCGTAIVVGLLATAVAALVPPPGAEGAGGDRSANVRAARNCDLPKFVVYAFGGVTCRQARYRVRWMRHRGRGYPGFNCSSGSGYRTGAYCERGRRVFGFHPYD